MSGQYLSESELNSIKGITNFLNGLTVAASFEVACIDSNGESIGTIKQIEGDPSTYALHFPERQ